MDLKKICSNDKDKGMGVFFFRICVKEITLKYGCIVLSVKLVENCK